jgi:hypothetical protein
VVEAYELGRDVDSRQPFDSVPTRFDRRLLAREVSSPPFCGTNNCRLSHFHSIDRSSERLLNIGFAMNRLARFLSRILRLDGHERQEISTRA